MANYNEARRPYCSVYRHKLMSDIEQLVNKIQNLDIHKRQLVSNIVNELSTTSRSSSSAPPPRSSLVAPNIGVRTHPRKPIHNYVSQDGVPLAIGDRVEIQTTRKVGSEGDIAEINQFNRKYIAVTILHSGKSTQRASKYLKYIE